MTAGTPLTAGARANPVMFRVRARDDPRSAFRALGMREAWSK
jgi:hypothetical protein